MPCRCAWSEERDSSPHVPSSTSWSFSSSVNFPYWPLPVNFFLSLICWFFCEIKGWDLWLQNPMAQHIHKCGPTEWATLWTKRHWLKFPPWNQIAILCQSQDWRGLSPGGALMRCMEIAVPILLSLPPASSVTEQELYWFTWLLETHLSGPAKQALWNLWIIILFPYLCNSREAGAANK